MVEVMSEAGDRVYSRVGGLAVFRRLAAAFYAGVAADPVLRPLYPESLADPEEHLALFMAQYFGGPPLYSQLRGHPRLRMRHLPFAIGQAERDAWVRHMLGALEATQIAEPEASEMRAYFEDAATFLMNRPA